MPTALTGARLREHRLSLGVRQGDLAQKAGISASYLNLIEHNRRNITPEVLERLAEALGLDPAALSGRAPERVSEDLHAAAAAHPAARAELDRIEDFARRFPGWAALVAEQQARTARLEHAVAALNDRLGHDPHLSAALHELLSALSGVRATAGILAETEDLSPDWQHRFHQNLHQDSERLAHGAEALVAYLDRSDLAEPMGAVSPQEELETWLSASDWHLPEVETGATLAPRIAGLASVAARRLAEDHIAQARADAKAMPLAPFTEAMAHTGADPALLAAGFGVGIIAVLRRIAALPGAAEGLVICDASGTILYRKPAAGFALPRFGGACPLWPLFQALARPGLPILAEVHTPADLDFQTLSYCETHAPLGFSGPEIRSAAMLIRPRSAGGARKGLAVGSTCRICPRAICPARREPSILDPIPLG